MIFNIFEINFNFILLFLLFGVEQIMSAYEYKTISPIALRSRPICTPFYSFLETYLRNPSACLSQIKLDNLFPNECYNLNFIHCNL